MKAADTTGERPAQSPDARPGQRDVEAQQPQTYSVTLLFDQENGVRLSPPKRQQMAITPALARAFVRAAHVSGPKEPPLSFSSLLVAMVVDEDKWLNDHFTSQGVDFAEIALQRPYNVDSLRGLDGRELEPEYLTTTSARGALEEAMRIARTASSTPTVDLRHVCAAYPILPGWHLPDFDKFGIDRLEWARSFGAEMARSHARERKYWAAYADRASPVPLTSFSADVYTQDDLLGIDRTVDALALLVASTRTATPLAIGVFGPWGSGKSFFMRHLQRRIVALRDGEQARIRRWLDRRAAGTAQAEDVPLYYTQIAQVEFNAWHYNEGNLLASLVEHLFRNLRVTPEEDDEVLAQRRAEMLGQLQLIQRGVATIDDAVRAANESVTMAKKRAADASAAAEGARAGVQKKADEIQAQAAAFETERRRLDAAMQQIQSKADQVDAAAVIAVALGPLEPLWAEIRKTIAAVRHEAFDWRAFAGRVFSVKGLLVVALCVAAPVVLTWAKALEAQWAAFLGAMMAALGAFGNVFDVLKQQRARFEEKLEELDAEQQKCAGEARAAIEKQHEVLTKLTNAKLDELRQSLDSERNALAAREAQMAKAADELARRMQEHDEQLARRAAAEEQAREAQKELDRLSSSLLLEEFIKDRSATDEYRKQLGFLALVRRDIERLSQLIEQANRKYLDAGNKEASPVLNRIVLYIDDLDRCKDTTVLAVLEAVHLLLAFPLFVCAVAVDPRWIEKCLRKTNSELFTGTEAPSAGAATAAATVGDYLEKIFQIPMWMAPVEPGTRAALVNSLLGPTASPVVKASEGGSAPGGPKSNGPAAAVTSDAFQTILVKSRETPDPLRISEDEGKFIDEIAALLSDRPRALKRLVNVYRLLKASLPDIQRASFVDATPSSAYKICLTQLALFTSHPRLAAPLVAALGMPKEGDAPLPPNVTLRDWCDAVGMRVSRGAKEAIDLLGNRDQLQAEAFRYWLPYTSRYMFHRVGTLSDA
jgi:phage shock protein A